MSDHVQPLSTIRRPALLVRAARFALRGYCRQRDLDRLIPGAEPHPAGAVLPRILAAEAEVETARRAGAGHYDPARHIALLVAIMGEARLLATA